MKHTGDNDKYQIKVNRASTENEKLFPYSKFLKNNYSQLSKIAPKNSILYKLKLNPDIIINEYHQTSNNINTNINIKTHQTQNSNVNNANASINNISFGGQPNNFSFNKYYGENETSIKDEDNNNNNNYLNNNNKTYLYDRNIQKYGFLSRQYNSSEKRTSENNDHNSGIYSPFSNRYSTNNKNVDYNNNNINYIKDIKYSHFNKKGSNFIFQSPFNDSRNKKNKYLNTDRYFYNNSMINNKYGDNDNNNINKNYLYSNYGTNVLRPKKNYSLDIVNTSNALNYKNYNNKNKSQSINIYNFYDKPNSYRGESSIESFKSKKMKEMNSMVFSSGNRLNNIFGNKLNNSINNNYPSYNNFDNSRDTLNIKLENYRIKLFTEFMKHFLIFFESYKKKIFKIFFKKLKINKYKNEKLYIYNRKSYFTNTIENNKQRQSNMLTSSNNNTNNDLNLFDIFKSSTSKDYYKLYNQLKKNKSVNPNLKPFLSSTKLTKDTNNTHKRRLLNKSLSAYSNNQFYLNSAPRLYKNFNNLSINRIKKNKTNIDLNSKSPSFRFGNKTIINNDISFGNEGNQKENELFRDSKELFKKYEQIQRRKKKSQNKNRENIINSNKEIKINKSADIDNIINSNEYNEFNEIRKNLQSTKKNNSKNKYTLTRDKNIKEKMKNKHLIKINSYEDNIYNSDDNNYDGKNQDNDSTKKDYSKNRKKNNNINIQKDSNPINNSNKNERPAMLRKRKGIINSKNKFITKNVNKSQTNNIIITDKKKNNINNNNIINKYKQRSYKKVKVNDNNKIRVDNKEKEKTKNNYNIIKQMPKLNNTQIINKNNIYYTKKNNKKNIMNNCISTIIKNISTKDNRIHININYYNYTTRNNFFRRQYYVLEQSENISICLFGDKKLKDNLSKLKLKLSSIKEEELSNQNSKFYDESGTFGINNNNTYESRKNNVIFYPNELVYKQFIEIIDNLFIKLLKKDFIGSIKLINSDVKIRMKKNEHNKSKVKNMSIVYRKRGAVNGKILGDRKSSVINSKKNGKKYEGKIKQFRINLIRYILNFSK